MVPQKEGLPAKSSRIDNENGMVSNQATVVKHTLTLSSDGQNENDSAVVLNQSGKISQTANDPRKSMARITRSTTEALKRQTTERLAKVAADGGNNRNASTAASQKRLQAIKSQPKSHNTKRTGDEHDLLSNSNREKQAIAKRRKKGHRKKGDLMSVTTGAPDPSENAVMAESKAKRVKLNPQSEAEGALRNSRGSPSQKDHNGSYSESASARPDQMSGTAVQDLASMDDTAMAGFNLGFFSDQELREMDDLIAQVGPRRNKETNESKTTDKSSRSILIKSTSGKRLEICISDLSNCFGKLIKLNRDEEDEGPNLQLTRAQINEMTADIETEIRVILGRRLPLTPKAHQDTGEATNFLKEMYFTLIPSMMSMFRLGIQAYRRTRTLEDHALRELSALLKHITSLVGACIAQPRQMQPTSSEYMTIRPYQQLHKKLQGVRAEFYKEVNARTKLASTPVEPPSDIKVKASAEREARRRRNRELREAYIREQQRNEADPYLGPILKRRLVESQKAIAKSKERLRCRTEGPSAATDEADSLDLVEEDNVLVGAIEEIISNADDPERVHVFGTRSQAENGNAPLWDPEELGKLVDAMRWHRYEQDVFENLAIELDKSIEDVFSNAKDLHENMETARERGQLLGPSHEWTKYIWSRS